MAHLYRGTRRSDESADQADRPNPLVSPAAVLGGEPPDQHGDLGADRRSSCRVRVGPFTGDQAAVPPKDSAGGDQAMHLQPSRQTPDQRGEDCAVRPSPAGAGELVRCSTATSCRSTSSSAFLEADDRPSRASQPQSWMKMR